MAELPRTSSSRRRAVLFGTVLAVAFCYSRTLASAQESTTELRASAGSTTSVASDEDFCATHPCAEYLGGGTITGGNVADIPATDPDNVGGGSADAFVRLGEKGK
jgi:hypothetical protein